MHPNPAFRKADPGRNLDFARRRGFGMLAINAEGGPLASHVPFVVASDGNSVELHLVRSNPMVRALEVPVPALLAVTGPDGYVSPDWYHLSDQVPTWNYVSVHLRGRLELLPQSDLRGILDRISGNFESRLLPKKPWLADKMPPDVLERMMRQIVPVRMAIESVDGTWKLGQNKPERARLGAADGVASAGIGSDTVALAALMRDGKPD